MDRLRNIIVPASTRSTSTLIRRFLLPLALERYSCLPMFWVGLAIHILPFSSQLPTFIIYHKGKNVFDIAGMTDDPGALDVSRQDPFFIYIFDVVAYFNIQAMVQHAQFDLW